MDNPSAGALRRILRQIMVAQIFFHSEGSNCEQDWSAFLLRLAALKRAGSEETSSGEVAADEDESKDATLLLVATLLPPPKDSLLQQVENNVHRYMAGYIAKKLQMKLCASCRSTITGSLSGSNNELLLVNKQFSFCKGKGLEIPGSQLVTAVQVLEKAYSTNIMQILHADNVKACLVSLLKKEIIHAVLVCPLASCEIENLIIDKFINVRLHFRLKDSSASFSQKSVKSNKKMMKLCHQ